MAAEEEEDEVQMMLRIEAEERARMEAEVENEVQPLQQPAGNAKTMGANQVLATLAEWGGKACRCVSQGVGSLQQGRSAPGASLRVLAKRNALLGLQAFGGSRAQVALLKSQAWRPDVVDDAAYASLVALVQCDVSGLEQ